MLSFYSFYNSKTTTPQIFATHTLSAFQFWNSVKFLFNSCLVSAVPETIVTAEGPRRSIAPLISFIRQLSSAACHVRARSLPPACRPFRNDLNMHVADVLAAISGAASPVKVDKRLQKQQVHRSRAHTARPTRPLAAQ